MDVKYCAQCACCPWAGGAGGAMAPSDFERSVNPISTKEGRLCPPNNIGNPGFSDLPKALHCVSQCILNNMKFLQFYPETNI